ncbi:MAG: hypothetical protein OMM_04840 [Candidatus Magnetoglobus multicellularis str. Araruama]|uniref:Uncharacterized protein n=1 Tax=Candidatus Magnetoglobus multicellularis str. Araruama TaxID=890399 RepID=A0A1V1NZD8_9BACT|nr:MAG: hypothetical protein OMM_04840 [Candidatus Magnetoglobus multicellularis str. Araruama]
MIATSCNIPFEFTSDPYDVAITSINNKLIIFGNGKIYELIDLELIEKGHISYVFQGELIDYADNWDKVEQLKTVDAENIRYLIIKGSFGGVIKPVYDSYEILEFNLNDYSFSKNVVKTSDLIHYSWQEETSSSNHSDLFDLEHMNNNNILVSCAKNVCGNYDSIRYYSSYLNLFDISTGNVINLGKFPFKSCGDISLFKENAKVYSLVDNKTNNLTELYEISVNNIDNRQNQLKSLQFIKYNDKLYATWNYGYPFDGRWNSEKKLG